MPYQRSGLATIFMTTNIVNTASSVIHKEVRKVCPLSKAQIR